MDDSRLIYFDKKTGESNHIDHIKSFKSNNNNYNSIRTQESVALLEAEPVPLNYDSVPSFIINNEDVITDDGQISFYNRWRFKFYSIFIFIILITFFILISFINLKTVINSIDFKIDNIQILENKKEGILINFENIEVDFKNHGIYNWIGCLNNSKIQFIDDITINNGVEVKILDIVMSGYTLNISFSEDYKWNFNLSNIFIYIQGNELPYFLNELTTDGLSSFIINTKLEISGKSVAIKKKSSLKKDEIDRIIDNILPDILDDISFENLQINIYEKNTGFIGLGNIILHNDIINKVEIPLLSTTIGFNIEDKFYKLIGINITKSTINESDHLIDFDFILFNIDKKAIKEGLIDELIWRIFNDDSGIEKFKFVIKGNDYNDVGWFHEIWKEINFDIKMEVHNLFEKIFYSFNKSTELLEYSRDLDVRSLNISLNDFNGQLSIESQIFSMIQIYLEKYKILINGNLIISGIKFNISNFFINKDKNNMITDFELNKLEIDILDERESLKFIQSIIDNTFDDSLIHFDYSIGIISDYFEGNIEILSNIFINLDKLFEKFIFNTNLNLDNIIEIIDIRYIDGDSNYIRLSVDLNLRIPFGLKIIENNIKWINIGINYMNYEVCQVLLSSFKGLDSLVPLNMEVLLDSGNFNKREKIEEFIGKIISGATTNITINGVKENDDVNDFDYNNYERKGNNSISNCNFKLCEVFEKISIPLEVSSKNIINEKDNNYFIRETIMHIISKEVEMTLFNPISNRDIIIEISEGEAICEGYIIGYLKGKVNWEVKSGIWNSPKVKVEYANAGSAGWKIIEDAIKGDGNIKNMTIRAVVKVYISNSFGWKGLNILYESTGNTNGKVRW